MVTNPGGFNGAMSFQTWIDPLLQGEGAVMTGAFQWCHVFSDMDRLNNNVKELHTTSFNGATSFQTWTAGWVWFSGILECVSMGPRLFRHGQGGHFSAFSDVEKIAFFTHLLNF